MATAIIRHLELVPTSYYGGAASGWVTVKANAQVFASSAAAQAFIDAHRMYAVVDTPGTTHSFTFNASGTQLIPTDVTHLDSVQCIGAGGGGGGGDSTAVTGKGGGGGGGGAFAEALNVSVISGSNLVVTVGTGGAGGAGGAGTGTQGGLGGFSGVGDNSVVKAAGGTGGYAGSDGGYGNVGGSTADCHGTISFNGGDGDSNNPISIDTGGGGGASANHEFAGNSACFSTSGKGQLEGGSGGNGSNTLGLNGFIPGGGGGGGGGHGAGAAGGNGGDGIVTITLTSNL